MSWNFSMRVPVAADGGLVALEGYSENYTYNVAPMFVQAFGNGNGIRMLNGKHGSECIPLLDAAIRNMRDNRGSYEVMNPPNGWGDCDGALMLLETLASWCREVPSATLVVR